MSFKNKIIFVNATILVLFVALLTYFASEIVQGSSQNQFEEIKESITGSNKKLLFAFVKAQSVGLDKEVELITEEVEHVAVDFGNGSQNEALRNKQLAYLNTKLKPFIKEIRFIETNRNQEVSIIENGIVSRSVFVDLSQMSQYKGLYIDKEVEGGIVSNFSIYVKPKGWNESLLRFDIDLDYFSRSLMFEDILDVFQYRYFLIDDSGKLVVTNLKQSTELLMSTSVFDQEVRKSAVNYFMSHDTGSFAVTSLSGVYNVTFVKNSVTKWKLILVTPEHVIRSSYVTTKELVLSGDNSLLKSLLFAYIILLGLFLVINSIAVNKLLMPVSKLIAQAQYLKQGDFNKSTHVVHSNGDEIEQLSKAYSEAGGQIRSLIEGLEYEVEERTKQYEVAALEASEANKQKSVLLSNVSHEVRTPLNAIIGYTHMLAHSKHFDAHSHQLNGISSASNTILGIVDDLLDFERVKAASYSLNPKCLSVMSLLREIENTFLPLSESKQLSLDIISNVDASTTLLIDELRIKQAISNLVSNALKFTNKGGVTIEVSTDDKVFNISVTDTGCGIPKDKLETVFNAFEQVNRDDQQFGFGLGLAITKTIVELMNGTLRVESKLGVSSTFVIALPALEVMNVFECSNGVVEQIHNIGQGLDCTNKKALIVDDVEFNREILEFHLNALGFECMTVNDGLEGLALASEHDFDVVLTDISMPVMDGIELASELEKRKPSLPIIAVTARATIQEESRMNQYFSCYLTKPLNPSDLKLKLQCALSGGTC
ncbi:ATP-binding protein [Vibrio splendidus]|uniref:ATP-binding protein n=1 Tax=Vibrio splendidus TaxID=29497 RepID=UPI000C85373D|nr:ATP-binding protein [Vibrio splendidus]PMO16126.1 hybrid sensor histidine kinase/response regulator [Vibrio splendidus]